MTSDFGGSQNEIMVLAVFGSLVQSVKLQEQAASDCHKATAIMVGKQQLGRPVGFKPGRVPPTIIVNAVMI